MLDVYRVTKTKVVDLTRKEYQQCYRLNFGYDGSMQAELKAMI